MPVSSYKRRIRLGILPKVVIFVSTLIILHFLLLYLSVSKKLEDTNAQIIQRAENMGESYLFSEKLISKVAINDSIKGLDKKSTEAIELRTQELALRLADFLYERDQDILQLSHIKPDSKVFLALYGVQKRKVIVPGPWPREIKEPAASPIGWRNDNNRTHWRNRPAFAFNTVSKPLYREFTFVDLKGNEQIKIVDGAVSSDLKDVSKKENTYCRAEDYFEHLERLMPGEIYVSRVIGAYVPGFLEHTDDGGVSVDPKSAYAGKENPNGKKFEGIVRWATPVYDVKGQKTGYVTMALDHVHIMEFTDHVVTTDEWFSDISDAGSGNYAWLWDDEDQCISHPRDFFICGYDPQTGQEVPGWLSQTTYDEYRKSGKSLNDFIENLPPFRKFSFSKDPASEQVKSGNIPLDCKVLDMAPQCEGWNRGSEKGGSGSFLIFWSRLWKLTTYAAIPYYTGQYGNSRRGFGYVTLGAHVADFHKDAMVSKANLEKNIAQEMATVQEFNKETWDMIQGFAKENKRILFLSTAVLDLMTLLVLSFYIFRMLKPLKKVTNVAEAIQKGDLDQHIEVNSSDEIGRLAYSFNKMAEFLSKADKVKSSLMADQVETNQKLTREIEVRKKAEDALQKAHLELEQRVEERTAELKQSNEALKKAKILAEAASKAKGDFLANMSHEIRTPLNGIIGMAELALDGDLTPRDRNTIQVVSAEADSLLRIVNDILDFSKIEAGMLELESVPFNIRVLVEDLATNLAWQAEQKSLEVIIFISNEVPNRVVGDPGRLRQILLNLSGNALKFTHEGEIFIQVEPTSIKEDQIEICFAVTDTGIGIAPDKQYAIFESFTQADGSTTRKYGGTGLGISICKQLVELMGGKLMVTSIEDEGSTFSFNIFCEKAPDKEDHYCFKEMVDLSGLKVLVVDDMPNNRLILTEYLEHWGCVSVEANNVQAALSQLKSACEQNAPFDLILTDHQMPEQNGLDLSRQIRSTHELKSIPILILTSMGQKGDAKACREIGIQGYLSKPIRRNELYKAVQTILGSSVDDNCKDARLVTRHTLVEDLRKNARILLVEDYPTNQQIAMRHLEGAGYSVDLAENGRQAFAQFKRHSYDLILMDIQMPEMDGYQATDAIRNYEAETKIENPIPIIAMTAHALQGYKEKCLAAGMDDFITKPLKQKDLLAMARRWIPPNVNQPILLPYLKFKTKEDATKKEQAPGNDTPPLDYNTAIEEFGGDEEFLLQVIGEFLTKVLEQIKIIRKALKDNDTEAIMREAHAIKGGAGNLLAEDLLSVASQLEQAAIAGTLQTGPVMLERLETEIARISGFVESISSA